MKTVTAGDANRQFSSILREVVQGQAFTVLSRQACCHHRAPAFGRSRTGPRQAQSARPLALSVVTRFDVPMVT
jgi:antitoxin (DNA-binding transcriptional repressor) of toxin-antitoxin stability system